MSSRIPRRFLRSSSHFSSLLLRRVSILFSLLFFPHQGTALSHSRPSAKITMNADDCEECSYLFNRLRNVCAYDGKGAVKTRSVNVLDIDVWGWQE